MKIAVIYFSRTGCAAKLADRIRTTLRPLGEIEVSRIEPVREHGYWGWLVRSFLPGWRAPIRPVSSELEGYDLVCLGFPKWTLSCPPLNQYIREMRLAPGENVGLFMSFGGFDAKRYLRGIANKVTIKGARVVATAAIRRRTIQDASCQPAIDDFCRRLLRHGDAETSEP